MLSPQKNAGAGASPRTSVPLRGLFADGKWFCNCPQRLPAAKFETKNHGVNHGRWFYTCQRPQHQRCNFFLWASDAEAREKLTVMSNSRSEPLVTPQTPTKQSRLSLTSTGLITPQTERPFRAEPANKLQTPSKSAKARIMSADSDEFEWDDTINADEDDELGRLLSQPTPRQLDFGQPPASRASRSPGTDSFDSDYSSSSPRKAARTDAFGSPGKRKFAEMQGTPVSSGSLTPSSTFSPGGGPAHRFPPPSADVSSTPTPSKYRNALSADSGEPSDFALEGIKILESHGAVVSRRAQEELSTLLNQHELKMKGIIRGRDISRMALKKKDLEITRLKSIIGALEAQRELDKMTISELRGE